MQRESALQEVHDEQKHNLSNLNYETLQQNLQNSKEKY